jgi:hypothetical protein
MSAPLNYTTQCNFSLVNRQTNGQIIGVSSTLTNTQPCTAQSNAVCWGALGTGMEQLVAAINQPNTTLSAVSSSHCVPNCPSGTTYNPTLNLCERQR